MPVVRKAFTQQHEIAGTERIDMVSNAAGTGAARDERELHFKVVVPVSALACEAGARLWRGDGNDLIGCFIPREQTEGVAGWDLNDFLGAVHGLGGIEWLSHFETIVAGVETTRVEGVACWG